ncbi:MAG: lipoate--protein ligase family protein [Gemmatimonadota bacterium]
MAVDHALLEQVQRDGMAVLRLYTWQPACLSFGRNQPARGMYDAEAAAGLGIDIVRRPTGGMAVLHDRELTYSFSARIDLLGGPRDSYCAVNRALVAGLQRFGIRAALSGGARRGAFGSVHPCFAEPAAGEVVVDGRKLVGSAQRCEQGSLLQHGSILLDDGQETVARIARVPFAVGTRATSIRTIIGEVPNAHDLAREIAAGFEQVCGICLAPSPATGELADRAAELEPLYRSSEWTWRR